MYSHFTGNYIWYFYHCFYQNISSTEMYHYLLSHLKSVGLLQIFPIETLGVSVLTVNGSLIYIQQLKNSRLNNVSTWLSKRCRSPTDLAYHISIEI